MDGDSETKRALLPLRGDAVSLMNRLDDLKKAVYAGDHKTGLATMNEARDIADHLRRRLYELTD